MREKAMLLGLALSWACGQPGGAGAGDGPATGVKPAGNEADPRLRACPEISSFDTAPRDKPCTEIGCVDGFELQLSRAGAWAPGRYTYEITADGQLITCEGSLPLKPCGQNSMVCSSEAVGVVESGCALPPEQQAFGDVLFYKGSYPQAIKLVIKHDGKELLSQEIKPTYRASQPNGPGCEPVCCQGSAQLSIP